MSSGNSAVYLNKCYEKDASIVSRKIDNEVILVPIRQKVGDLESIYTLNEVASRIWELIDGKKKVKEIKEAIIKEFDVSPEPAEKDVIDLLQQLEKMGSIKTAG